MRTFWIVFGLSTQVLFAVTVWQLYYFLEGLSPRDSAFARAVADWHWLWLDALLALQFGVLHSLLLLPTVRNRLERFVPNPQYGCFFCLISCFSLQLTMAGWQSVGGLWELVGITRLLTRAAFVLSWPALLYSLYLTGLGYQTGWTPWWAWVRGRKPLRRQFVTHGAYRLMRHPIYLSFLGLVWLTPVMTLDRAVLGVIWTGYILIGSCLKDRRLLYFLGDAYRDYQARVPGYPFLWFGPLGKIRRCETAPAQDQIVFVRPAA